MAKILLNIPDELKEALEDRIDGIFAPRNTTVTHAIRSALYFIIQQNNIDFGNLLVWGHTAEVSFKGYSNLYDKYKEEGYIPDTIPRGTGHQRAFMNVMVKFYEGEIDEKEFRAFIKELEEEIKTMKYAPEMHGYQPPDLFEKMREFVRAKHEENNNK